ncbi:hypothetical protein FJ366_01750 [Candidatus Dependentiae bacterium]|nr:hypothetical protein [Candidatus Dependentiae bacterium]
MPEEIISAITEKASRDCITKHTSLYVTNYPSINAFCARNLNNCKIIISHHWFESDEKKQYLNAILEHEFGHAREHHNLKAFIINSFLFTAGITCCYLSTLFIEPTQDTTTYFLLFNFIIFRITTFLQTWYTQHNEYQADAQALSHISPQEMISALLFLKANSASEQIRENQPSWIGTHPKISDRIKAIEKISQKNTDIL